MKALRKRLRPDSFESEQRKTRGSASRRIYLALLILFGIGVIRYIWGDWFLLRSDGLVLRDQSVIEMGYLVKVVEVAVDEGQMVKEGELLLKIESMELLERIADLSNRQANLMQISAEFTLIAETAKKLLLPAQERKEQIGRIVNKINKLADKGVVSEVGYQDVLKDSFEASETLVKLQVESATLEGKRRSVDEALYRSEQALKKLEEHYNNGIIQSPTSGLVGASVPHVGNVYDAGEPLMAIYTGEAYVLAYLPNQYQFVIKPGMEVLVTGGRFKDKGVLVEMIPLSAALPQEFQNTFKPTSRNQLAKIVLLDPSKFPVNEKVTITLKIDWIDVIIDKFIN
ncbi:HlyD family secretion protein [Microbulbifer sp. VVAC002]|uniref:HlyD family secretion protein n=1 Tax=Microbulbifer sp. VVAC002 TaxID=3243387 RepID=UPI00403A23EB